MKTLVPRNAGRHPGALVKEARRGAGMTQAELAKRLGTKQPVIARLESPRSNPRFETVRRALAATGHDVEMRLRPARASVDETMIASNLRLSPADRLKRFREAYASVADLATKAELRGS
jgi:predicted transcriptional regulator